MPLRLEDTRRLAGAVRGFFELAGRAVAKAAPSRRTPKGRGKKMMNVLTEFGVESRIEKEDYLQGFEDLAKV